MKVQVVVDQRGNIVAALGVGKPTADGDVVVLRPSQSDHRLHELDLPDEVMRLSADEFHTNLKARLGKGGQIDIARDAGQIDIAKDAGQIDIAKGRGPKRS